MGKGSSAEPAYTRRSHDPTYAGAAHVIGSSAQIGYSPEPIHGVQAYSPEPIRYSRGSGVQADSGRIHSEGGLSLQTTPVSRTPGALPSVVAERLEAYAGDASNSLSAAGRGDYGPRQVRGTGL